MKISNMRILLEEFDSKKTLNKLNTKSALKDYAKMSKL